MPSKCSRQQLSPPHFQERKNARVSRRRSLWTSTQSTCACSFRTYHMPRFPLLFWKRINMWSNVLMKPPRMHFLGVLSRTRVTEVQFLSLVRHSLRCLIAKTKIPNGIEDFLNAYSQKCSNVDQRQRSAQYQSINTAVGDAPKPAAKPVARGVPVVVPPAPPPPPNPPALHPMPAAVPVVDDFNYVDSSNEGPEEVRSDSSLEMLDEEEELGRSTQGWD